MKTSKAILISVALVIAASSTCLAADPAARAQWWPGEKPGPRPIVRGTAANVSPSNIAVQTRNGLKPFIVNDKTKVVVRGEEADIGGVNVGDTVVVRYRLTNNDVPLAKVIVVPRPGVKGKIVAMEGDVVILRNKTGEHRILVTDETRYKSRGYEGTLADLRVGYRARAAVEIAGDVPTAMLIHFVPAVAKGTVAAIEGDVITVKTVRQLNIDCAGSSATAVLVRPRVGPNRRGTLAEVQVGMPVNIGFHPNRGAPCPLLWIHLLVGSE